MTGTVTSSRHTPSIREIAQAAGVSPATVSRAFNQPELLNPDTLARILAVAGQHDFRPSRVGSSLRSGSTRTLGLIAPTLSNPVFAECFEGAEQQAREAGYSVMLTATAYDARRECDAVRNMLDHRVEGLILTVANAHDSPALDLLEQTGTPYVLAYNESPRHPSVSVDNRRAAMDMVQWLAQRGLRHIAFVSGPLAASDRARSRLRGAQEQACLLGMPEIAHLVMADHTRCDADTLRSALADPQPPQVLFCSNDLLATSTIGTLRQLGLRVPGDISVCGFDGMAFAAMLQPSLATVSQPSHDMGRHACALLLPMLDVTRQAGRRVGSETATCSPSRASAHDAASTPTFPIRLPYRIVAGGTVAGHDLPSPPLTGVSCP